MIETSNLKHPLSTAEVPRLVTKGRKTGPQRRYLSLDDFERLARRRLPRMIHGFIANGSETEATVHHNRAGFENLALIHRVLTAATTRSQSVTIFGRKYDAPFGIAPMGAAAACAYRADIVLASAANAANVPMILSASSLIPMEDVRQHNRSLWHQAYLPGDDDRIKALLSRVLKAGFEVLVITADGPLPANRENNARNGFSIPVRPSLKASLDCAMHPRWLVAVFVQTLLKHGLPKFENLDATRKPPLLSRHLDHEMSGRDSLSWRHLELIRKLWPGKLVVKGVLSSQDAQRAREAGADGVILSNHGGRQLDTAISPLSVLEEAVAVAGDMKVMLDGGVRRGTDVLKALSLGASFVFLGRPFLFSAAIEGEAGASRAIAILKEEINRDLGLLGADSVDQLGPGFVRHR